MRLFLGEVIEVNGLMTCIFMTLISMYGQN